MSSGSTSTVSSDHSKSTVHYARPFKPPAASVNTSINSECNQSGLIQYPSVSISEQQPVYSVKSASAASSPNTSFHRATPPTYSATQLQYENMKQRCKMLDFENQRLMRTQNDIVNDANRRVEMHINEIRMLKEENKKLTTGNKELRDLCCLLDDDRQKARRFAKEWQKFGKYTSHVMKQEMQSFQQRMQEMDTKCAQMNIENENLRQLCLYLDEQRQHLLSQAKEEVESEDLGCGSSERSSDSGQLRSECDNSVFNQQKENALRLLNENMELSEGQDVVSSKPNTRDSEKLLNYIQSLESRIKYLEVTNTQDQVWNSSSNVPSDSDEKTIIERWDEQNLPESLKKMEQKNMTCSTSTMTSSGTTYGSLDTDMECSIFVMGEEPECFNANESRILDKIMEESDHTERISEGADMPPPCAPLSASLLSVGRLSMTSEKDYSPFVSLARSASASHSPLIRSPIPSLRASSVERTSVAEAVQSLRIHELRNNREVTARPVAKVTSSPKQVPEEQISAV